jgi:predicted DNA-binding transcriptional regulator YafY
VSRRADRLFQIVQVLRGRRLTTAALLAQRLGVSERTVYRDIQALSLSGVPVEGEAGIGYRLRPDYDVPPLMFTSMEVEAMVAGLRLLKAWGGGALAAAADPSLEKLMAALPPQRRWPRSRAAFSRPSTSTSPPCARRSTSCIRPSARNGCCGSTTATRSSATRARGATAGPVLLGQCLAAGGVVHDALRLPQLPAGPLPR